MLNPALKLIMKIINLRFLLGILCIFTLSTEAANQVSLSNISELDSGNLKIVFNLDKVALINSYALDDPSRIVVDLKDTSLNGQIKSESFVPIKLIRASEVGGAVRIVIDLKGSVYWKKPWQVKYKDRVDLILEIKRDKKISTNLRDIIVAIDAGHGGKDPGAVNSLGTEAGYNLKIAKLLQDNLKKRGFKVVMTRSTDVFLTLQERVKRANLYRDAIFISIHFNSVGSRARSQARGIETFTLSPVGVAHYGRGAQASDNIERMGNAQDSANIALATAVHWSSIQLLARAKLEVPDRGIRRARYSVLTGVKHPAILFEGGFMSHPKEKYLINNPTYQRTLAKSMCEAIVFYRKATMQKIGTTKR